ncbi:S-adenosyl-L-methionine-dependent methyltransferase [Stachybotrys elegans]|uniref:S-adenosyl-L-methionine-dependent methyltransferase n=1 Tax=Stachybotrys elegans TaxID=80388 RepID=A0A8K0SFY4_9HYPO|nr:S-adenosyl-L-methionine-dependent methyltransferase [Stachybotrys elegans]
MSSQEVATNEKQGKSQMEAFYDDFQTVFWFDYVLGGARHFGYFEPGTWSPFPMHRALERMEAKLFEALQTSPGSRVLEAGCGAGHVAAYMAKQGLHVTVVDILPRHIRLTELTKAKLEQYSSDVKGSIEVRQLDYHHLDPLGNDESYDSVYTIEAFVHASDPMAVLGGFFRNLKPGGRVVMHEYEQETSEDTKKAMEVVNDGFNMPLLARSYPGILEELLERAGFRGVEVKDLSENVRPMTRLNYYNSCVPFTLLKLFGADSLSPAAAAGVQLHKNLRRGLWKYLQVTAVKPLVTVAADGKA